ncbi:hypothetical protein [Capnocytophaga canimorsus]|uniref:hypothetical protein n=1 Tax=Capnocytophaga canimorsus TaxID=28188 RepID=UPI0037CE9913
MARNKISDLKDHLFAQLERLNDENLTAEQMQTELEKAKAMEGIAKQIIDTEKLTNDRAEILIEAMDKGVIPVQRLDFANGLLIENQ